MKTQTPNDYLEYALAMAFADGLLDPVKQVKYTEQMRDWFSGIDIEAEYERIQKHESGLPSATRRRITALVEYVKDKERLGPGSVKGHGEGLFM